MIRSISSLMIFFCELICYWTFSKCIWLSSYHFLKMTLSLDSNSCSNCFLFSLCRSSISDELYRINWSIGIRSDLWFCWWMRSVSMHILQIMEFWQSWFLQIFTARRSWWLGHLIEDYSENSKFSLIVVINNKQSINNIW